MTEQGHRLLYVNPAAERGGGEVVLLNLLRYLPRTAIRPEVALLSRGPLAAELRSLGVRTYVLPAGRFRQPWRLLCTLWHLVTLARHGVALVDSAGAKGHIYGGIAAWLAGIPAVWRLQDVPTLGDPWTRLAGVVPAAGIVANAKATLAAYLQVQPRQPPRSTVIYPGVEYNDTTIASRLGSSRIPFMHDEFGLPSGTLLVTMVGRLQHWKGQHIFLEAAANVLKWRDDVHFLVVGATMFNLEPEYALQLKNLVEREGIANHVTFSGQRNDVQDIISLTDVLIHASITPEPFGQVIVEGMAQGKAVIATAAGGPLEIISDDVDGLLVPPGDASALAHAILALLDDPARRERLGQAAMLTMRERFTADRMAAEFIRFYERVLSNGGKRSPRGT